MKKFLFFASAIAGLFLAGSCQREMMDPVVEGGVTYTITLDDGVQTKGANGYTEYDLYYQIYKTVDPTELETAVLLFEDKVEMTGNTTHVALELLNSQDYTVLFWANRKGADWFELGDLRNVVLKETLSNNDNRDAFCGKDELINFDDNLSKTVQLKRPFAQINIATLVPAKEELGYDVNPEASLVRVSNVPVAYNVAKAQTVGTEEEVTFGTAASPAAKLNVRGTDYKMVAMNYVLVPAGNINDLYYEITTPNGIVKNTIHNIPVKPNYRTNIIGNLLTSKADYTVEILPGFENSPEGDEIVEVWNGSAVTKPVWNEEGQYYEIRLASELAWFAQQVNQAGVDTRAAADEMAKDYKLMSDIDLQNQPWVPIGANAADQYRYKIGTFDGQGYTIKNLKVDRNNGAGLFGYLHAGTIKNVNIDGFEINSNHYGGAVLAWGESSAVKVNVIDCHVKNGTVTVSVEQLADGKYDNGDKAGSVVGWNYAGNITGNTAENVTVTAYRDLGGILGYASKSTVTGNTINNVILVQDLEHNYKNYTAEEAAGFVGSFVGRVGEASTIQDNNGEAITDLVIASEGLLKKEIRNDAGDVTRVEYYVIKKEGLWEVAKMVNTTTKAGNGSWNIALTSDIDLNNEEWTPIGTGEGGFTGVFDGQGHTISNLKITGNNNKVGLFANTYGGEIKNLTIHNASVSGRSNVGVVAGNPYTSKYTNINVTGHVEVDGKFYVGGVGGKNAYADWTNITVDVDETSYVKANSVEDGIAYRTYVGGVVGFNGEGGHSFTNITSNIDVTGSTIDVGGLFGIAHYGNNFVNCSSSGDVEITDAAEAADAEEIGGLAGVWHNQDGETVTFENCKFTGTLTTNITEGVDLTDNTITGKPYSETGKGKLIIDGWEYIADGVAFKDDVYELYNAAGLKWFAAEVNQFSNYEEPFKDKTVKLTKDIDLGGEEWTPIGDYRFSANRFCGTFDGQGHTVSNFKITKKTDKNDANKSSYGFFGNLEGTVKNFTVSNVTVDGAPKFAAAMVGRFNSGNIENCHVKASKVYLRDNWTLGGLVAQWNDGKISGCTVEDTHIEGGAAAAAIAGIALNNGERLIENCHVKNCTIETTDIYGDPHAKMFGTVLGATYSGELVVTLNGCTVENSTVMGVNTDVLYGLITEGDKLFVDGYEIIADGVMSKDSNYYVSNLAGFNWFADQVNGGNTFAKKTVNLTSDIDLNNEEWTPIGNSTNKFQGIFDGNNKTVSNLIITGYKSDVGLFGMTTNGEIKNLVVNNAKVSGRLDVGVVVGNPYTSKYTNIKVTGHVEVNGMSYVGGVGGKNAYANWTDVTVDVDETSYVKANSVEDGKAYRTYVGGVCGFNGEGGHSFTNITSNIDVTGTTCDVGGLFGIAHYGNKFVNCSCSADVEITDADDADSAEQIGGIAGVWNNGGSPVTFENCKFTGTLTANITEGVDLTDNTITGKAYSATGTGQLIIK